MKKTIFSLALLAASPAMALNVNIGYPVDASRMSLTGDVTAVIDCSSKAVTIKESDSYIFDKHLRKNINVMCYKDDKTYTLEFRFHKGKFGRDDMIATQTSRFMPDYNKSI